MILIILLGLFFIGCAALGQVGYRDKVVVLMYHHLDGKEQTSSTISPEKFASHIGMLAEEGFNIIPIQQLGDFLTGTGTIPAKAVVITFDDGYRSNYEHAYPVLKKYDFPATIFMIVSRVGRTEGEIPKISWEEMIEMQSHGISFQSHSFDGHYTVSVNAKGDQKPVLAGEIFAADINRKESSEARQQRVYQDLKMSKEILEEKLGETVEYFAVPYGWYDEVVIAAANQAGLEYIFTIKAGANHQDTDPTRLYRVNAGSPDISAEELKQLILKAVR